jgi:hypothetical protein
VEPNADVPVFAIKQEGGKGGTKTVHCNLLLPLVHLPVLPGGDTQTESVSDSEVLSDSEQGLLMWLIVPLVL